MSRSKFACLSTSASALIPPSSPISLHPRRNPRLDAAPSPSPSSTNSSSSSSASFVRLCSPLSKTFQLPPLSQRMMRVNEACDASLMDSRFSWNVLNLSSTDANAFSPPSGSTYTTSALSAG